MQRAGGLRIGRFLDHVAQSPPDATLPAHHGRDEGARSGYLSKHVAEDQGNAGAVAPTGNSATSSPRWNLARSFFECVGFRGHLQQDLKQCGSGGNI